MSIPRIRCPNNACARELWDERSPHTPEPGMINVCLYCLQIMKFITPTSVRAIELADLTDDYDRLNLSARLFVAKHCCINCGQLMKACIAARRCGRVRPP